MKDIFGTKTSNPRPSSVTKPKIHPSRGRILSYRPKLGLTPRQMTTLHYKFDFKGIPKRDQRPTIECDISETIPLKIFLDCKNELAEIVSQSENENVAQKINVIKHLAHSIFEKLFPKVTKTDAIIEKLILSIYYTGLNFAVPNNDIIHKKLTELLNLPHILN